MKRDLSELTCMALSKKHLPEEVVRMYQEQLIALIRSVYKRGVDSETMHVRHVEK